MDPLGRLFTHSPVMLVGDAFLAEELSRCSSDMAVVGTYWTRKLCMIVSALGCAIHSSPFRSS